MFPDDGLPSNVCPKCVHQTNTAYEFKKKCEASDSKLRVHLCKMQDFQVILQFRSWEIFFWTRTQADLRLLGMYIAMIEPSTVAAMN
jgi:hypothetical protein